VLQSRYFFLREGKCEARDDEIGDDVVEGKHDLSGVEFSESLGRGMTWPKREKA